jgi:hypothetical protein
MAKTQSSLRQEAYSHACLSKGKLIERFRTHWSLFFRISDALKEKDAERLLVEVDGLEMELVRYAMSDLHKQLQRAAREDCAALVSERVLDASPEQPSLERLKCWLTEADFWPLMAADNWAEVTENAADVVLKALDAEGLISDEKARRAIYMDVRSLQLSDLIPIELAEEIFPAEAVEEASEF